MKILIVTESNGPPMYEPGELMSSMQVKNKWLIFKVIEAKAAFEIELSP